MTTSSHSQVRALAGALKRQTEQVGASTPSVKGSDWRLATVTAVGTGTVTADGMSVRRLASYSNPQVGDLIVLSLSSAGNWVTPGRLATATGTWTPLTLAGGWAGHASYFTPSYLVHGDGTASLSGLAAMSGALATGATVATLPAEATPASFVRVAVQVAVGYFGVMSVTPGGLITLGEFSAALPATGTKWAEYDVLTRYRLA